MTATNTAVPAYMARIRHQIRSAEAKADESLLAKLEVLSSILRARQVEDIPAPHIGQDAIVRLGRAIQSDISSANDVFRSHNALNEARVQITGGPGHEVTLTFAEDSEPVQAAA
ncbi:hypothetical protein [Sphingopyxis solisilvae]|uniref:hypothetical protein n=1 Tax=Sphingopyxis solisilvae TaxID=1886788 RepID=UPI001892C7AC|nr:hypothetical protein [Sphingopyxis solisilvae]